MISSVSSSMASSWANKLFTQLDTKNQGYIEQSDLESAFSKISDSTADVEDVFTQMDSDSDGKVTENELTTALQQVAEELDSQFNSMRMQGGSEGMGGPGGPGGMPPPPPPENDTGFTAEELASQLEEIGDTDSKRSELISNVLANFDEADSDGDGKVTFQEAMALDQSSESSSSTTASATTSSTDTSSTSTAQNDDSVLMKIMQLMQAYQVFGQENDESNSAFSITA